jgi:hydroxymethylpyrimidine kinase/phosphomethylpyrimidine kinase/thiamine-phosphate diphosphorylase
MKQSMGIYPIVSKAVELVPLLQAGCRTLQLRVKSDDAGFIKQEVARAVAICQDYGDSQLFINDHWRFAMEAGAFGVHLGQEDWQALSIADQALLSNSGLRLGLSTHNLAEMALAHAARPSYIAIGPLFGTTSKRIEHPAVGLDNLRAWVQWLSPVYPVVTIGGIELAEVAAVKGCGVDGIAVIGAVKAVTSEQVLKKAQDLLSCWKSFQRV